MLKKQANRFFKWYCHPDYYEDIQGDLEEIYQHLAAEFSPQKASRQYAWEVLLLFRPSIIRPFSLWDFTHLYDMLQNYFKISFRNLAKHHFYTLIHILGLALGLTAFLLINQYTVFEKSYDRFHHQADQLYRLTTDNVVDGKIQVRDAMSFAPSGKALQEELPEVISATTTYKTFSMVFRKNGQPVEEKNVIAVDSNFFNLFNYSILKGNLQTMLNEPYTMVLTESQAKKYFGNADPMGQTIDILGNHNRPFKVTGLLKDTPENTHYKFDILLSLKSFTERIQNDAWNGFNYYTYLKLDKNADLAQIQPKLPALTKKYLNDQTKLVFNIQPVTDIHLHSDFTFEPEIHGSARAVHFLNIISVFILLIAWINYINLSTARAMERAKEVGMRKVVGAKKSQLMGQFFTESLLINGFGAITALLLAQLATPYFNELVGKAVLTQVWNQPDFLIKLGLFFLVGTLVTGIYPALILSSFQPISVLKGAFARTQKGIWLRKGLVIFQFAASLVLIAATIIVYQQIQYMTNKDLGIDTAQVIGISSPARGNFEQEQYISKYKSFLEELKRQQGVVEVGSISNLPGGGSSDVSSNSGGIKIVGQTEVVEATIYINSMNDQIQDALGMELIAGRNFNHEFAEDSAAVIVNQAFLNLLQVPKSTSVINEYIQLGRDDTGDKFSIVGVLKDYNRTSLKSRVEPTVFFHREATGNTVVKLNGGQINTALAKVETLFNQFFPQAPFNYTFLDNRFAQLYQEDKKFGFIFANFAGLAIFVALLGLFGLASYLALQRTKEVGVRKVLGASIQNIVFLFFKDFLWLILIAMFIGVPLVYWSMNQWLSGYAYRIDFPWWVIGIAMLLMVLLAFFTVSYQTFKIALLNPAKTIKHE